MLRIGLTGGIGSGKSMVARLFAMLGVPVYDTDSAAKRLMNSSDELKAGILALLGERAYDMSGKLDRAYVSSVVFLDKGLLHGLDAIVHPAVGADFEKWAAKRESESYKYVINESAILYESGFDARMDYSVTVSAPVELRIGRVTQRDALDVMAVRSRIANQMADEERERRADYVIVNDGVSLLVPQVEALDKIFSNEDR